MSKKISIFIVLLFTLISLNNYTYAGGKNPGDKAENFTVKGTDGKEYTLSDALKNTSKGLVVMFWSTECPYVQPYTTRINNIVKTYSDKGFTFWGVNANDPQKMDEVKTHAAEKGYNFLMAKDENNKAADMFGATRTPEIFVIDPNMVILYHGRIDNNSNEEKVTSNDLVNALEEISAGKEVSVKTTKSFGCSIKRVE